MPKLPMDYSKSIIYKIVCKNPEIKDCYVGSTTNYDKRKWNHKYDCNNEKSKNYNYNIYKFIRDNGNWENFDMIEIEKYNCNDKLELHKQERFWLEELGASLNCKIPSRSKKEYKKKYYENNILKFKEYHENNKQEINEKKKEYYEKNKQEIAEKQKEYREKNKQEIKEKRKEKGVCNICNKIMRKDSLNKHKKNIHNI